MIGCSEAPCATCPYRRDVPSGVWAAMEYAKLPAYDAPTGEQPFGVFMCHADPKGLCTGWVQCHSRRPHEFALLALRLAEIDSDVWRIAMMAPLVKLFRTGAAAAKHGMRALARPGKKARAAIERLTKKRHTRTTTKHPDVRVFCPGVRQGDLE
jgi:hypothetical protein